MHSKSSLAFALVLLVLTIGCAPKQDPSAETQAEPLANTANMQSLETVSAATVTPPPGTIVAPTTAPATPPPVTAIDFTGANRPTNERGEVLSDLDLLNQILNDYVEARATGSSGEIRTYKTEAEEVAAMEARQKASEPVKDLSELVKAGLIKAVPTPPPGKRFAIDPKTQKVVLLDL
ncbi:MAG: hypothetical protein AB1705_10520 [Verrucomicrobiota bacterium]